MDFQIPRNFLIRNPPKIVQIGPLGARTRPFYQIWRECYGISDFLRSGGDCGVDFQIPHNFLIRNPPKIVQIGPLEARIRPFYQNNQESSISESQKSAGYFRRGLKKYLVFYSSKEPPKSDSGKKEH